MTRKALVGVSSCLLGEEVRHDGGHKLDDFISGLLAQIVELRPVCPEVDIGLGVPREPIRLLAGEDGPRLVAVDSGTDLTAAMKTYAEAKVRELDAAGICGYVLKARSPSCGFGSVPVDGGADRSGLFAAVLSERCDLLPLIEETGLQTRHDREVFLQRVLAYRRLRDLFDGEWTTSDLIDHHARQDLLLLAQSAELHSQLAGLVAEAAGSDPDRTESSYRRLTMKAFEQKAGAVRHSDALAHLPGCIRDRAGKKEYGELEGKIETFREGGIGLFDVLEEVRRLVKKHCIDDLAEEAYLEPHPAELLGRNRD